jgi:hypothetical protein
VTVENPERIIHARGLEELKCRHYIANRWHFRVPLR